MLLALNIADSAQQITDFMDSNNYTVPTLLDTNASVAVMYGIVGTPTTFFINSAGVIKYIQIGAFSSLSQIQTDLNQITS